MTNIKYIIRCPEQNCDLCIIKLLQLDKLKLFPLVLQVGRENCLSIRIVRILVHLENRSLRFVCHMAVLHSAKAYQRRLYFAHPQTVDFVFGY